MRNKTISKNIRLVLDILEDEVKGNVTSALSKLSPKYKMTWMYRARQGELFPRIGPGITKKELSEAYKITGRNYDIRHIGEGRGGIVMLELIETYPAPKGSQMYRTPLVLVLELRAGKIVSGRHYCDPRISRQRISIEKIDDALN